MSHDVRHQENGTGPGGWVASQEGYPVEVSTKRGRGRPKHTDDRPVFLATTIPKSLDRALREHKTIIVVSR